MPNPQICLASWCFAAGGGLASLAFITVALTLVLGVLLLDSRRTVTPSQAAARANRHATLSSLVGAGMLVLVLAWLVAGSVLGVHFLAGDGQVLALVPAMAGACLLGAQAVGQVTWPRPTGVLREAELARRAVADVVPARQRVLLLLWAGSSLVLLLVLGLVADTPRAMIRAAGRYTETLGPYPGSYFGIPVSIAVVVLVIATELVLRLITQRPAVAGVSPAWDMHLRRRSARHVTHGIQVVLAATTSGVLVVAGRVHVTLGGGSIALDGGGWALPGSPAQLVLGRTLLVLGVAVAVVALGSVLPWPRRRQKADGPLGLATTP